MSGERDLLALFDDTLEEGPMPAPRDLELRHRLADQRFVHGLLRAQAGSDAASREARVRSVLAAIDRAPRRPWARRAVLTAVVLAACVALPWWLAKPSRPLRALCQRALHAFGEDTAWSYSVELTPSGAEAPAPTRHFTLTVAGGGKFLLTGSGPEAPLRIGCDGGEIWCAPADPARRWRSLLRPAVELLDQRGLITSTDLDLRGLLADLRDQGSNAEPRDEGADGVVRTRVSTVVKRAGEPTPVEIMVDPNTGVLRRVELPPAPLRARTLTFAGGEPYPRPDSDFACPW